MQKTQWPKDYYKIAFSLGVMTAGFIITSLGQSWNRDDMALLHSYIKEMKVEQDRPRLVHPAGQPQERSSTTAQTKIINKYYKMEPTGTAVPGLPRGTNEKK